MTNEIVALLPMKANSERVKGKNFKTLAEKPLFRWILDTLLSIEEVDKVIINTDARDLLREHGLHEAERILIRDRKTELCGDFVSMNSILSDDISAVPAQTYLMTHTTNPLLSAETIMGALKAFKTSEKDSLFTVNKIQTRFYRSDVSPINHDPNNLIRTQDLETWFEENSNLYIFTQQSFARSGARIGVNPMMFETPPMECFDIDNPNDWDIVEAIAEKYFQNDSK